MMRVRLCMRMLALIVINKNMMLMFWVVLLVWMIADVYNGVHM